MLDREAMLRQFRSERAQAQAMHALGLYARRRPAAMRAVGCLLHPEAVTEAWYATLRGDSCSAIALRLRLRWRVSRLLRGAKDVT